MKPGCVPCAKKKKALVAGTWQISNQEIIDFAHETAKRLGGNAPWSAYSREFETWIADIAKTRDVTPGEYTRCQSMYLNYVSRFATPE